MAELRLNSEMNLLSTRYRVRSDCACRFKRQKWMVEVLRETSSDIGRIGPKGHERELLAHGHTLYDHTAITPVIVCPGRAQVIALAPEYIMPPDGHAKQDCEQAAGKRWVQHHAATLVSHHVTLLGDDLYSKEPFCALALQQGFNFILVCKPDSHPKFYKRLAFWQAQGAIAPREQRCRHGRLTEVTLYRFINEVLLQDGKQARSVNWVEMTVL